MLSRYEFRGISLLLGGGGEEQDHSPERLAGSDPAIVETALDERRGGIPHGDAVFVADLDGDAGQGIGLRLQLADVTDENDQTKNYRNSDYSANGYQGFSSPEVTKISLTRMAAPSSLP